MGIWVVSALAIMNNTIMSICVQVYVQTYIFISLDIYVGSFGNCLTVWENTRLFSKAAVSFNIPTISVWRF